MRVRFKIESYMKKIFVIAFILILGCIYVPLKPIGIGDSPIQVRQGWGLPARILTSQSEHGQAKVWIYNCLRPYWGYRLRWYSVPCNIVRFENGIVSEIESYYSDSAKPVKGQNINLIDITNGSDCERMGGKWHKISWGNGSCVSRDDKQ